MKHLVLTLIAVVLTLIAARPVETRQARTITVGWDATDVVTGYRVAYGTASGVYTRQVFTNATTTRLVVAGLLDASPYYFAVQGMNLAGNSLYSNEVAVPAVDTPPPSLLPPTPTGGGFRRTTPPSLFDFLKGAQ